MPQPYFLHTAASVLALREPNKKRLDHENDLLTHECYRNRRHPMSIVDDDIISNVSNNQTFEQVLHARVSRRSVLCRAATASPIIFRISS